jgi:hypothetical protein
MQSFAGAETTRRFSSILNDTWPKDMPPVGGNGCLYDLCCLLPRQLRGLAQSPVNNTPSEIRRGRCTPTVIEHAHFA